jgi:hypothetical protein
MTKQEKRDKESKLPKKKEIERKPLTRITRYQLRKYIPVLSACATGRHGFVSTHINSNAATMNSVNRGVLYI